ncbi:MAG: alcohol dehydrogenase catalytic domain-containing protein [Paracoccaceae bacterium]|nr:alcohol dehydrogenase catalytic domain-containing protein [Paracoccaceae bacterium]MDE2739240.1 alcohol dehydrogenase catalytic domain-containing protein [Paracoccaceae bacterium]MXZ49503.1 alcohol dehydrogenase catalytic domain-containing protein [Paracoccaceae bacterium]MYF45940.1 alcohol dehydrogenase catalytic domain-containing protein [Paracoccaceae bacterium]MYG10309.1 alcohol dehydrogenase catalytic domain-containing protein [Paracoccaceae bacterium]
MNETYTAAFYRGNRTFTIERQPMSNPKSGEVLIQVSYCGICGTDMHAFHGNMDERIGFERIIGHEMSGTVVAIGKDCNNIEPGNKVVVRPLDHCSNCPACHAGLSHICHKLKILGLDSHGAMQEFWKVPAHTVHLLPDDIQMDLAAMIEPLAVACHDVRLSELKKGEDVLVIGGGPIGALVALMAREAGGKVVISEINPHRTAVLEKLEFDIINPSERDLVVEMNERTSGKGIDVVFEVSGSQAGVDAMTAVAATRARLVLVAIHAVKPKVDLFQFFWRELELMGVRVYEPEDYEMAIDIITNGKVDVGSLITDVRSLSEIQLAFEDLDQNPSAMKTLITMGN